MDLQRIKLAIPASDGLELAGDVMLPSGGTRRPALVTLYPYHKDDVIGSLFEDPRVKLVEAGYGVVLVDVRGHGTSPGERGVSFDLAGKEGADAAAVVEWVAQRDWCTGAVGIWGVSYGAMLALAAAARQPPHLRAIAVVYGTVDPGRDSMAPGGVPLALSRCGWAAHMLAMDLCPPTRPDETGRLEETWRDRLQRLRHQPGYAFDWHQHRNDTRYWNARAVDAGSITVPTFLIGGWQDRYLDAVVRLSSEIPGTRRLVIGPWLHVLPDLAEREPYDWIGDLIGFFGEHCASGETHAAPRALIYVRSNGWRAHDGWPPSLPARTWTLTSDHRLHEGTGGERREVALDCPAPVGLEAGFFDPLGTGLAAPIDQHRGDMASLCFDTENMEMALELAGRPEVDLVLGRREGSLHLAGRLELLEPSGSSTLLSSGWAALGAEDESATLVLEPVAALVPTCHRLRLALSAWDFPRCWPGSSLALRVITGGANPSRLRLPCSTEPLGTPATVPQPQNVPRLSWSVGGDARYRRTCVKPGHGIEAEHELRSELATPSGAALVMDDRWRAAAPGEGACIASIEATVKLVAKLSDGSHCDVDVKASFTAEAAHAHGVVRRGEELLLDADWASKALS